MHPLAWARWRWHNCCSPMVTLHPTRSRRGRRISNHGQRTSSSCSWRGRPARWISSIPSRSYRSGMAIRCLHQLQRISSSPLSSRPRRFSAAPECSAPPGSAACSCRTSCRDSLPAPTIFAWCAQCTPRRSITIPVNCCCLPATPWWGVPRWAHGWYMAWAASLKICQVS